MSSEYSLRMSFCYCLEETHKDGSIKKQYLRFPHSLKAFGGIPLKSLSRPSKHTHLITHMSHTNRSPDRWHVLKSRSAAVIRMLPESISPHPFFARMPVKYIICCMVMRRASDHAPALSVVSLSF